MAIAANVQEATKTFKSILAFIALTLSGSYVVGGDTLDLTKVTNTNGEDFEGFFENPQSIGLFFENLGGYYAQIIPGATLSAYKIKIFAPGGAELGAVTYASVNLTAANSIVLLATRRAV